MSTACAMDVHKGWRGPAHVDACGQRGGGQKPDYFVDVINGWPFMPSDFPPFLFNFPPIYSSSSPIFRCSYVLTLNFLLPTKMLHFLPPKLTKSFVSPLNDKFHHKMGMMKIYASSPSWDGPQAYTNHA